MFVVVDVRYQGIDLAPDVIGYSIALYALQEHQVRRRVQVWAGLLAVLSIPSLWESGWGIWFDEDLSTPGLLYVIATPFMGLLHILLLREMGTLALTICQKQGWTDLAMSGNSVTWFAIAAEFAMLFLLPFAWNSEVFHGFLIAGAVVWLLANGSLFLYYIKLSRALKRVEEQDGSFASLS